MRKRMKTEIKVAAAIAFALNTGCNMISDQMNGDLKAELEDLKMTNYAIVGLLIPPPPSPSPASAPLPNIVDNRDGTVYVASQNLTWAKCSQSDALGANMYNSGANDCSGAAKLTMYYCLPADNSCNVISDPWILNGKGTSQAYNSCHGLNNVLSGHNWRVPTISELREFTNNVYLMNSSIFPATGGIYLSSSASPSDSTRAWGVFRQNGVVASIFKADNLSVRCVSTGP
ncbi:MAG: DUF1566 domain-containing protein [Spirochaetia bacterium]|nr:DUF1566 domain-containing protein [Spirochaetia bacterium]